MRPPPGAGWDREGLKIAGVAGSPAQVAISLSPCIQNAAFEALGLDWLYLAFGIDEANAPRGIRALMTSGIRGMNVTMPHKAAAAAAVDRLLDAAHRIGVVNTISVAGGALIGHNTDGEGLVRFLESDAGAVLDGAGVVVIGAGGAARAAIDSVAAAGAGQISVLARDPVKAQALAGLAGKAVFKAADLASPGDLGTVDIIINATPAGQADRVPVIAPEIIRPGCIVVDMVYRPPVTPLVEAARARGAIGHSGIGMLLHQAALSFEIWTGTPAPMDAMSAAALAELAVWGTRTHGITPTAD